MKHLPLQQASFEAQQHAFTQWRYRLGYAESSVKKYPLQVLAGKHLNGQVSNFEKKLLKTGIL